MITTSILLVLHIYIRPTRLLEDGALNAKFNTDKRLYPKSTGLGCDDSGKIEEAITANKDNKNEEDPQERNRQLKKEKQH